MSEYVSVDLDDISKVQDKFGKRTRIPKIKVNPGEEKLLRIVKAPSDRRFFIVRVSHWNIPVGVGKTPPQACSYKHFGKNCYFCEVVNDYFNSGDPRKAELARNMKPAISYTSNVVDINDPTNDDGTPKVQLWSYSESVFKELMYYVKNKEEYGDIFHPETGRDIRLQSEVVGSNTESTYTKHKIKIRGKVSPVFDMAVFDHLHDLEKERPLREFSYEQQIGIFDGSLDYRNGEAKALLGNEFGIPKLMETKSSDDKSFAETVEAEAEAEVDDGFEEAAPVVKEESPKEEADEWETALSDESDDDDEKVADIKKKLKATLNKRNSKRG